MNTAPIALFAYNRPLHIQQTVEALQKNELAPESELFVYSDGFKSNTDKKNVLAVREYLETITGFSKVTIIKRENNLGLALSIITGVTEIISRYGRIIVLEDDMVTSPYFLDYMNEALCFYKDEDRVISIHAYMYPVVQKLPETFFLRGADCWGWATWKRGWDIFEPDGSKLLVELSQKNLIHAFDYDGTYQFSRMLQECVEGKNDSWAVRWNASAFINGKLTLYPGRSLVANIGIDGSGRHCGDTDAYASGLSYKKIKVGEIAVEEDQDARNVIAEFFRSSRPSCLQALAQKVRRIIGR